VNSGAEVVSGGDIVILGTLRGVAHAGAYEESGGGRVILALNMQPTQLRIGAVISRGGATDSRPDGKVSDSRSSDGKLFVEIARVDGTFIVVEPYQTKTLGKGAAARVGALASTVGLLGRKRGAA
jgi:septum site-determining protein MinC